MGSLELSGVKQQTLQGKVHVFLGHDVLIRKDPDIMSESDMFISDFLQTFQFQVTVL